MVLHRFIEWSAERKSHSYAHISGERDIKQQEHDDRTVTANNSEFKEFKEEIYQKVNVTLYTTQILNLPTHVFSDIMTFF